VVTLLQQIDVEAWPDPRKLFFAKPLLKRQAYSQRNLQTRLYKLRQFKFLPVLSQIEYKIVNPGLLRTTKNPAARGVE
jgi:hypothetical protein